MNVRSVCRWIPLIACLVIAAGCASSEKGEFASPDAAAQSLVAALRDNDQARLREILAPAADDILSSGDEVSDRADVARFLSLYDAGHRVQPEPGGDVYTLVVGRADWPFPVPIVKSEHGYVFDSETGRDEIRNRRIGRNELDAQQVCLAIVDAQREYVARRPTGGDLPEYAQKLVSDPGRKNGLYWPTAAGEQPSPLGPLVASATSEGYGPSPAPASPAPATTAPAFTAPAAARPAYHGYRYRLLTAQGPQAPGGELPYMVDGRLIGGFGVVAYPAQYGNSGIMTFITSHDGMVYQRDFGPQTEQLAESMAAFDPGPEWTKVADASQLAHRE